MFKIILIALLLITASCSNNQPKSETKGPQPPVVEANPTQLQLNNSQKWKLDEATRQNMKEMKAYIAQASHAKGGLSGEILQKQSDKLIKECRMSGPGHDALHAWLVPFLQHVQEIKSNHDVETASHAVNEDVKAFDTYFE